MGNQQREYRREFVGSFMVGSEEWDFFTSMDFSGGSFSFSDPKNGLRRTVVVGTKCQEPRYHAETFIHEILEIFFDSDRKRFIDSHTSEGDHSRYMFVFDHDYLDSLSPKIITALLSSGMFSLKDYSEEGGDPVAKKGAKKGGKNGGC